MLYFSIITRGDKPIYKASLSDDPIKKEDLNQFIIHSSLDLVDLKLFDNKNLFLKVVDKFNNISTAAYVTPSHIKFMLLFDNPILLNELDISVRNFFVDVHQLYLKFLLNPFYNLDSNIKSEIFDQKVKNLGKKYFIHG